MDEERVSRLELEIRRLTERVERLETGRLEAPHPAAEPLPSWLEQGPGVGAGLSRAAPLVGRTFLILGGAFAIRAVTDAGLLPKVVGVGLALCFAIVWFILSHRALSKQQPLSGVFHAIAGALIAFPLLVEATTRLGVLPAWVALAGIAAFGALLLGLASRHRLLALAWVGELAALAAVVALLVAEGARLPPTLVLLFIGAATLLLADRREWYGLRWPVALLLDAVVLRGALSTDAAEHGAAGPLVLVLAGLYFGAFAFETLWRGRKSGAFEIVQAIAVVGVWSAQLGRTGGTLDAAVMLAVAAGALAVALKKARVAEGANLDLGFYSTTGLVLLLLGGSQLGLGEFAGLLFGTVALLAAGWGRRLRPGLVWAHAAVLSFAAATSSKLWAFGVGGIWAAHDQAWAFPGGVALTVLGLTGAAYALEKPAPAVATPNFWSRVPSALLLGLWVVCATGTAAACLALVGLATDAAVLALVRTALLVSSSFVLAGAHRRWRRRELAWLAYAMVAFAGLKLLVEGLSEGRAATLFAGFALFGASLIFVPRIVRGGVASP